MNKTNVKIEEKVQRWSRPLRELENGQFFRKNDRDWDDKEIYMVIWEMTVGMLHPQLKQERKIAILSLPSGRLCWMNPEAEVQLVHDVTISGAVWTC